MCKRANDNRTVGQERRMNKKKTANKRNNSSRIIFLLLSWLEIEIVFLYFFFLLQVRCLNKWIKLVGIYFFFSSISWYMYLCIFCIIFHTNERVKLKKHPRATTNKHRMNELNFLTHIHLTSVCSQKWFFFFFIYIGFYFYFFVSLSTNQTDQHDTNVRTKQTTELANTQW